MTELLEGDQEKLLLWLHQSEMSGQRTNQETGCIQLGFDEEIW